MWGIFIGSLMFVAGFLFSPVGLLLTAAGMMLALVSTARYAVDLLTSPQAIRRHVYEDDDDLEPEPLV